MTAPRWLPRPPGLSDWLQRRLTSSPPEIPVVMWQATLARMAFADHLSDPDRQRLKTVTEQLLAKKPFAGAAGLTLTDEMAVWIAAQAALPVLNLDLSLYDDLSAVIVVPDAVPMRRQLIDESGVVHEWEETLAGEAVDMGGAVMLSWPDLVGDSPASDGSAVNIVIHEFVHKIDMGRGGANGYPPFLAALHAREDFADWPQAFGAAFEDFCQRVDEMEAELAEDPELDADPEHEAYAERYDALAAALPMDPYAASDPAEFFAVASESFFVVPAPLAAAYPEIYRLLARYYRQDPLVTATRATPA